MTTLGSLKSQLAQLARHDGVIIARSEHYSPRVEHSSPVKGYIFLLNLFCSNTILVSMPE